MGFQLPERKAVADFLQEVLSPSDQVKTYLTHQLAAEAQCRYTSAGSKVGAGRAGRVHCNP
jgi:hypothetical protein